MTQLPIMIRRRRYERPLPRPPPTRHHQPSRHLLSLIVALFSPCLSRYTAPIPEEGLPATVVGFQVASESRSTYKLTDDGWKIATREYTTLFVDPE